MSLRNSEQDARDLYDACSWSTDYNIVRSQLEHGTDPDHQFYYTDTGNDRYGCTPLHRACYSDNVESARALIRYGAHIEAIDSDDGNTPLHYASLYGSTGAVQLLVEHNCNTDSLFHCLGQLCHVSPEDRQPLPQRLLSPAPPHERTSRPYC